MSLLKRILATSAVAAALLGWLGTPAVADSPAASAAGDTAVSTASTDNNHSS
ncbi:hypothetical protein ACH4RA_23125 [Streptomyces smyrnaeus]|uniref:Uncharacterized protein n=1 Tax=Streptomyces smyrnaeus TaxID=1387713 RepID=A0ABS3XWR8_9ACTN|nr:MULTISPECIES: hypothetical protein [Streptomyces]MBO8199756.1 hypothetical protein [Streptomyces smyrnaeus]MBQ0867715.1 hypothetical protein [Streptomyces sp. RK75]MBQ1120449.1 hypothetical protein [Streptomyces sp. B15]MBQ1159070.1 hypothetical protein [Streptomyces sp. A73]